MKMLITIEQFDRLRRWVEIIANTANDTDASIRAIDLVYDLTEILAIDEQIVLDRLRHWAEIVANKANNTDTDIRSGDLFADVAIILSESDDDLRLK